MRHQMGEHPVDIIDVVGGQPQLGAIAEHAGQPVEILRRYDAALVVPRFRPGIGKQDEGTRDRGIGQPVEQQPRIVGPQAHIAQASARDMAERGHHAIDEGFAADQPDRQRDYALRPVTARCSPPPKPISSQIVSASAGRTGARGSGERAGGGDGQRAAAAHRAVPAARPQLAPGRRRRDRTGAACRRYPRPSPGGSFRRAQAKAERSWSARSVRSQLKPPSLSGVRPKWP